jgi:hypothetical protein
LNLVAVIASFNTIANLSIAAARHGAIVQTRIRLNLIGVVTRFHSGADMTITTSSRSAGIRACVRLHLVAVVTSLVALLTGFSI